MASGLYQVYFNLGKFPVSNPDLHTPDERWEHNSENVIVITAKMRSKVHMNKMSVSE